MLDLNLLRKEFAQHLLDNHGRFSFDQALYHVLKKAYEKGQEDAAGIEVATLFGGKYSYRAPPYQGPDA